MNLDIVNKEKTVMHALTSESRVRNALDLLLDNARKSLCYNVLGKLESLEYSYNSLLNYFAEGYNDPQRDDVHRSICESLHNLIDDWADELIFTGSTSQRAIINSSYSIDSIEMLLQEYNENRISRWIIFDEIFNIIWAIKPKKETPILLQNFISNTDLLSAHREALVGAVFMQLMQRFSPDYIDLLFNLTNSDQEKISSRALVCLIFSLFMYHDRVRDNARIQARLDAFLDDEQNANLAFSVLVLIEQSRISGSIESALEREIMPELIRIREKYAGRIPPIENNTLSSLANTNINDWDDMFNESPKLQSKLEKLNDWQLQGVDILFPTFSHLKNFRFFDRLSSWMMPFTVQAPEVSAVTNSSNVDSTLINIIDKTSTMCDSDKYSVIFSFGGIPFDRKDTLAETYKIELAVSDEMEQEEISGSAESPNVYRKLSIANHFIHDLYRLIHINPHKAEFPNIFDCIPSYHEIPLFDRLLLTDEHCETLADMFVKIELYSDAAQTFENILSKSTSTNALLMRKTAFCHLKAENYNRALELFLNADLAQEDHIWTKRKIAQCYHKLGKYTSELFYLEQADELVDNNYAIKFTIGECLLSLGRTEDALKHFFEIHYNAPDDVTVLRKIAMAEFNLGKLDEAERYFEKIDPQDYEAEDYMLSGHLNLCKDKRGNAIDAYRKSLRRSTEEIFIEGMKQSEEVLGKIVGLRTIAIVIDTIIRK